MNYWSKPGCLDCQAVGDGACEHRHHGTFREGYEAGFEAAMRSLVTCIHPWEGRQVPRRFLLVDPGGAPLRASGSWIKAGPDDEPQWFDTEAEAKAAIATAPRWWPKQPWEVE